MWFKNLFKRNVNNPSIPIGSSDMWDLLGSTPADSGVRVNGETVLGSAGVWRAINLISQSVARLPIVVYKRTKDGGRERATAHRAYHLLRHRPAEYLTPYQWVMTMQGQALLHGNSYSYIFRDELATPTDVMILDSQETYPARENGRLIYVSHIDGEDRKLLPENVIHIKGLGASGDAGYSVVNVLKNALGYDLSLLKFGNKFFSHGSAINVVVQHPGHFRDEEAIKRFRQSWGTMHQGLENSHKVAILENGATINKLGLTCDESQFSQSMEMSVKQLANIFGIPASYLGADINTSYKSLEAENKQFLNHSLGGILCNWEQELQAKLLTEVQKKRDSHYIEFERLALERADKKTEIDVITQQYTTGLLSLNECRALLNMPSVDGGDEIGPQKPPKPPEEEQEKDEAEDSVRAAALTESILDRLVKRLAKDGKPGLMSRHHKVITEALEPAYPNADKFAEWLLTRLDTELEAVLPEQRKTVFNAIDIKELVRCLEWSDDTQQQK